jgi:hypothetical protein
VLSQVRAPFQRTNTLIYRAAWLPKPHLQIVVHEKNQNRYHFAPVIQRRQLRRKWKLLSFPSGADNRLHRRYQARFRRLIA